MTRPDITAIQARADAAHQMYLVASGFFKTGLPPEDADRTEKSQRDIPALLEYVKSLESESIVIQLEEEQAHNARLKERIAELEVSLSEGRRQALQTVLATIRAVRGEYDGCIGKYGDKVLNEIEERIEQNTPPQAAPPTRITAFDWQSTALEGGISGLVLNSEIDHSGERIAREALIEAAKNPPANVLETQITPEGIMVTAAATPEEWQLIMGQSHKSERTVPDGVRIVATSSLSPTDKWHDAHKNESPSTADQINATCADITARMARQVESGAKTIGEALEVHIMAWLCARDDKYRALERLATAELDLEAERSARRLLQSHGAVSDGRRETLLEKSAELRSERLKADNLEGLLETATVRANRLEYTVVSAWLNGDITEGTAVTALNLPIVTARERLKMLESVKDSAPFAHVVISDSENARQQGHERWRAMYVQRLEGLGVTDG